MRAVKLQHILGSVGKDLQKWLFEPNVDPLSVYTEVTVLINSMTVLDSLKCMHRFFPTFLGAALWQMLHMDVCLHACSVYTRLFCYED